MYQRVGPNTKQVFAYLQETYILLSYLAYYDALENTALDLLQGSAYQWTYFMWMQRKNSDPFSTYQCTSYMCNAIAVHFASTHLYYAMPYITCESRPCLCGFVRESC